MTDIKWQAPPPSRAGRDGRAGRSGKHAEIADALKARPGEWALILTGVNHSTVTQIRQARLAAYGPRGSFEAVGRNHNLETKRCDVYARFVGEAGA